MVRFGAAARLRLLLYALLVFAGLGAQPLLSQPFRLRAVPPASPSPEAKRSFQTKIDELTRALVDEPNLEGVPPHRRQALVEFIAGNMLFVAAHEMGLALLSEMGLPAVTGAEQAADDFAVLTMLKQGETDFSDRVLIEAAKGWFVSAQRVKRNKASSYYVEHRFNDRRGQRIVCLMIGADPARFRALAEETAMPNDQRRTCGWEYDTATRSWDNVLAPFRRAADQPKVQIEVTYAAAAGRLEVYARMFRSLQFLETIARLAADRFAWHAPIVMEMHSCGQARAGWDIPNRRLIICYEIAEDFAQLYRDFGQAR